MLKWDDYKYYVSQYCGMRKPKIELSEFGFLARKACNIINQRTFGSIPDGEPEECVRNCVCEIAEIISLQEASGTAGQVKSESVGDMSVTYATAEESAKHTEKAIRSALKTNLANTDYLYCGVYKC